MRILVRGAPPLAVAWVLGSATVALEPGDPAGAERQYRLAQRLGADRSPEAVAAYEKVVTLAPRGPYADDALVDLARLQGSPDWPEDFAALDPARAALAAVSLKKVLDAHADGDRALEARYRLALIRLAPLPGRDQARGRQDLIAVASSPSRERWVVAGRYALGVLDEQAGAPARAAGAFARILVEQPDADAAPRASAGFGRTLLAAGRYGDAAGWFQEAIEHRAPPVVHAVPQREFAIREVLRERIASRRWTAVASPLGVIATTRGASLLATTADGGLVVFDRKNATLQAFDAQGTGSRPAPAEDVSALTVDPFGRVFAATKDALLRWDAAGLAVVSNLGSFASPSAIAVDATGSVWLADRKGDRIAKWVPGTPGPVVVRESKGAGVAALAVAGGRVIAAEEKTGRIVAVADAGSDTSVGTVTFRRPVALAVDTAGRISVLDEKADTVTRLAPSGEVQDTLALAMAGVSRPLALAAAPDGAMRILDGATGAVAVAP